MSMIAHVNGGAPSGRMSLSSIHKGTTVGPLRILFYGPEGIGKTTFAAGAPGAIFLGAEDGFGLIDVPRFPEPRTWTEVTEAVRTLEATEHSFKTLVLDTVDWLEPLCWAEVCREGGKSSIEEFGYGKGYTASLDKWRVLLSALEKLRRAKGMHLVLLAHAKIAKFANPEGDDFDRYSLKLHDKAAGLLREWCDLVLFAQFRVVVDKAKGATKGKGIGVPERVVHTTRRAAFDAKNRYGLPDVIALPPTGGWEAVTRLALNPSTAEQLLGEIQELLPQVPETVRAQTTAYVERYRTDRNRLVAVANSLRAIVEQSANETTSKE